MMILDPRFIYQSMQMLLGIDTKKVFTSSIFTHFFLCTVTDKLQTPAPHGQVPLEFKAECPLLFVEGLEQIFGSLGVVQA